MTAKKKGKDRWTLLAEAAVELNKVLGLEPAIEVKNVDEYELEEKISEASQMIVPEDEFSDQTERILSEFLDSEDSEEEEISEEIDEEEEIIEDDEDWDEEETESEVIEEEAEAEEVDEEDEAEGTDLDDIRNQVEELTKRKYLRKFAQENEDIFGPVVEKLPELKSSKALKGAMLKHLDELSGFETEEEEPEEKDTHTTKSAPGNKSNKAIIYEAWDEAPEDEKPSVDALHELVEKRIKRSTVRNWVNGWKKGRKLPAIAKED